MRRLQRRLAGNLVINVVVIVPDPNFFLFQAQMCPKHGTDYLEYKCRYCCSVAVFFCFGTTHFCNACHDDFQRVANIPKTELPQCPVAPKVSCSL